MKAVLKLVAQVLTLASLLLQHKPCQAFQGLLPWIGSVGHFSNRVWRSSSPSALFLTVSPDSQLAQLASMTTLSIDSGDLSIIREYAETGYITDATTNPLFVSQAGLNAKENPTYAEMLIGAVQYAIDRRSNSISRNENDQDQYDEKWTIQLAMDRLAVNLGKAIADIVPGYVSTEVDPRLSFDINASVDRALRIIDMYRELGVDKSRVLIKLAATWEGIQAASILERHYNIRCNLTLIFSVVQAMACAQYGAHLISPFPGRILDWNNAKLGRSDGVDDPALDEGVRACRTMYHAFRRYGYSTICMPASWRPSRGSSDPSYALDEIRALAGTDRMTIPAPLLQQLIACMDPLPRMLFPDDKVAQEAAAMQHDHICDGENQPLAGGMTEKDFRYRLNMDGCGTDKLAEGIRAFIGETIKLEEVMTERVRAAQAAEASGWRVVQGG